MSGKLSRALIILLCFIFFAALSPIAFAEDEAAPVKVIFSCEDESALPSLHVFDQDGVEYAPMTDADSGEVQYGSFLLMPGEYSYSFHDEAGRYEDFSYFFTVGQAIKYIIPFDLTPVIQIESFSFTYIDPMYEGIITEADIPEISAEQIAAAEEALRELATVETNSQRRFRAQRYWQNNTYYDTIDDAALFLRSQIASFQDTATLGICSNYELSIYSLSEKLSLIWSAAIAHTGNPTEGDYLRYEYGGYNVTSFTYTGNEDGLYYYQIPFSFLHYTNVEQEAQLNPVVDGILAELDLNDKSDYQKILAIYDYLCAHVSYGGSGYLKYTAYSALINNTAYCQGYSTAFYRLCLSAGVDTRIVTSSAMVHAWNIAALDGNYYELDSTWDHDHRSNYLYFLKGSDYWLVSHKLNGVSTIGDQYNNVDFANSYPLRRNNYDGVPVSDDVLSIPVNSTPASLKNAVIDLESYLKMLAMQMPNGADDIDSFLVSIVYSPVSSDTNASKSTFDVAVSVAAYRNNTVVKRTSVAQSRLSPDYGFSFTLPVPDSWAGKEISYTRTGGGFSDDTGILTASDENAVSFSSIAHLGRFTLQLVKYTVSFDTDGGSTVTEQSVINGDKAAIPVSPTKDGYWFTGWYADSGFTTLFDFDTAISADTTVYARWAVPDFVLPSALSVIGEEAFRDGAFSFAVLPENAVTVGPLAFADCDDLMFIYIPASVEDIDSTAFGSLTGLTILGTPSITPSTAESFAATHGYAFVPISR